MADTSGMQDLKGLSVDKLVKGFADEENIMKHYCTVTKTPNMTIRWYQKTAGWLTPETTTGITDNLIDNTADGGLPFVAEQSWTRQTSYCRKYFVASPLITIEDEKDCDVDVLATNVRDLVRAVARRIDQRIINVLTESYTPVNIQTVAATADGWDDAATGDPILDLLKAKQMIRAYGYYPENAVLLINSIDYKNLVQYLISVKGSSIPQFASEKINSGIVMKILGLRVVVSENFTSDYACVFVPKRAVTWKQFSPITSTIIYNEGIGKTIRVWETGEALLTDPKAVVLITDTVV